MSDRLSSRSVDFRQVKHEHCSSDLPACITSALHDRSSGKIRRAADALAALLAELHGVPFTISFGDDLVFALIIKNFDDEDDGEASR